MATVVAQENRCACAAVTAMTPNHKMLRPGLPRSGSPTRGKDQGPIASPTTALGDPYRRRQIALRPALDPAFLDGPISWLSAYDQTLWRCLTPWFIVSATPLAKQTPMPAAKHPATSLPGALQVPFGEFTGFHYVALGVTNPTKWHPPTPTET